jgi:hypothetical protein
MDLVGIWALKFMFGRNMALKIPNNLFSGGNCFHTPHSRLRDLSCWPNDGLLDIEKSDRTFDRNAMSPRVVAVNCQLLPSFLSWLMISSAKVRSTSWAYHDPYYENRMKAAMAGLASGEYKNVNQASIAQDKSLSVIPHLINLAQR